LATGTEEEEEEEGGEQRSVVEAAKQSVLVARKAYDPWWAGCPRAPRRAHTSRVLRLSTRAPNQTPRGGGGGE
jgi:hypothetical protein